MTRTIWLSNLAARFLFVILSSLGVGNYKGELNHYMHSRTAFASCVVNARHFLNRGLIGLLGIAFYLLLAAPPLHGSSFDIDILSDTIQAGVPVKTRITARTVDGLPDPTFVGTLAISAQTFHAPTLVLSEVSYTGRSFEFTNPGRSAIDISGYELEMFTQMLNEHRAARLAIPPGTVLPPSGLFIWSIPSTTEMAELEFTSPIIPSPVVIPPVLVQVRYPDGAVADQVRLGTGFPSSLPQHWSGNPVFQPPGSTLNRVRVGRGNSFHGSNWIQTQPGMGQINPELILPWPDRRVPFSVTPNSISLENGVWEGFVTFPNPASQVVLDVYGETGLVAESRPFTVLPQPPLILEPIGGPIEATEVEPGTLWPIQVRLLHSLPTDLTVRLVVDEPMEFHVPDEIIIPAGSDSVTFVATNLDDDEVDGRAVVLLTASASGHADGTLTLANDDDEVGRLHVSLPLVFYENMGLQIDAGWVFLDSPALRNVEVFLEADPPLEVPSVVRIPRGQSGAPFPVRVGMDGFVNRTKNIKAVKATIPEWPTASGFVEVRDQDSFAVTVDWPEEIVEGIPATIRIHLATPLDHARPYHIESDYVDIQIPSNLVFPASVLTQEVSVLLPNNPRVDWYPLANLCVVFDGHPQNPPRCQRLRLADDEIQINRINELQVPRIVLSGTPFPVTVRLASQSAIPRSHVTLGELSLLDASEDVLFAPSESAFPIAGNVATKDIQLDGVATNIRLHLEAGGYEATSWPMDLLRGHLLTGSWIDMASVHGSSRLLLLESFDGLVSQRLIEVDSQLGSVVRSMDLATSVTSIAVSSDGSVAWLSGTNGKLQRIQLTTWTWDREVDVAHDIAGYATRTISVLKDNPNEVFVVMRPSPWNAQRERYVVHVGAGLPGRRSPALNINLAPIYMIPGRTEAESFLYNGSMLYRLLLSEDGIDVAAQASFHAPTDFVPHMAIVGDQLMLGIGSILSADTLQVVGSLPPHPDFNASLGVFSMPERDLVGYVNRYGQFGWFQLSDFEPLGFHGIPGQASGNTIQNLVPCGPMRFAQLAGNGSELRIWESPFAFGGEADLEIAFLSPYNIQLDSPGHDSNNFDFEWTFEVTNHGPDAASRVRLITPDGEVALGMMSSGETREISIPGYAFEASILRGSFGVVSDTQDTVPENNTVSYTVPVLPRMAESTRVIPLNASVLLGSPSGDRLYALVRAGNGDVASGIALINPDTASIERVLFEDMDVRRMALAPENSAIYAQIGHRRIVRWDFVTDTLDMDVEPDIGDEEIFDLIAVPDATGKWLITTTRRTSLHQDSTQLAQWGSFPATSRYLGFAQGLLWMVHPGELRAFSIANNVFTPSGSVIPLVLPSEYYAFTSDNNRLYFMGRTVELPSREVVLGDWDQWVLPDPILPLVYSADSSKVEVRDSLTTEILASHARHDIFSSSSLIRGIARWGSDGLAFQFDEFLILQQSPLVLSGEADLSVQLGISSPVILHEPFTLTITVKNNGPDVAHHVLLRSRVPVFFQDIQLETSGAWIYEYEVFHDIGTLPAGDSRDLVLTARASMQNIDMEARVIGNAFDADQTNNSARLIAMAEIVSNPTSLELVTFEIPQVIEPDMPFNARVEVRNIGLHPTLSSTLIIPHVIGLEFLDTSDGILSDDCCSNEFRLENLPGLEPNESFVVDVTLRLRFPGLFHLRCQVLSSFIAPNSNYQMNRIVEVIGETPLGSNGQSFLLPPGPVRWNESRQQWVGGFGNFVCVMDGDTFNLVAAHPIPGDARVLDLTDDGQNAWVGTSSNRMVSVNLYSGELDFNFSPDDFYPPHISTLAAHPTQSDLVIFTTAGSEGLGVVAYQDGERLPDVALTSLNRTGTPFLLVDPSGRVVVMNNHSMEEFLITPTGLVQGRPLDISLSEWFDHVSQAEDKIYFGDGSFVDLSNLTSTSEGAIIVADRLTSTGYAAPRFAVDPGQQQVVSLYHLPTETLGWSVPIQGRYSSIEDYVPMGNRGLLIRGTWSLLVREPDPPEWSHDVVVRLAGPIRAPEVGGRAVVGLSVRNSGAWPLQNARVFVSWSEGLEVDGLGEGNGRERTLDFELPPMDSIFNLEIGVTPSTEGIHHIRAWAEFSQDPEHPLGNEAHVQFETPGPIRLLLSNAAFREGDTSAGGAVTLRIDRPAPVELVVYMKVEPLNAVESDFQTLEPVFYFAPGSITATALVGIPNRVPEPDRTFRLSFVSGPVVPVQDSAVITILDDDFPRAEPVRLTVFEGDTGIHEVLVPVLLYGGPKYPVEVSFVVVGGSAVENVDFLPGSGRLVFSPGVWERHVPVQVIGNTLHEPDKTIFIRLVDISHGHIFPHESVLVLRNDDPELSLVIEWSEPSTGLWQIEWESVEGKIYRVLSREDFGEGDWEDLTGPITGTGGLLQFDVSVEEDPTRYFLISIDP